MLGFVCLLGWLTERFFNRPLNRPDKRIEELEKDYLFFQTLEQWGKKHNLSFTDGDKLEIVRSFKDRRLSTGSIYMVYIMNVAVLTLTAVSLLLSEKNAILQNLFQTTSSNTTSNVAQFEIQNMPNEMNIIIAIVIFEVFVLIWNFYYFKKTFSDDY
jgi:hypothetical protein